MTCIFDVSPFDGGWCVKISATQEVLFFRTGAEAERKARELAAQYPTAIEIQVHDRAGRRIGALSGDRWDMTSSAIPSRLVSAKRSEPQEPPS